MSSIYTAMQNKTFHKLLVIALVMFGLSSCFKTNTPSEILGEYVDINSDTMLNVENSKLTFSRADYTETYNYVYKDGKLSPKDNFGIYSEIKVCDDGTLRCEEMILDDDGHSYIFVRPEAKEEALKIVDDSEDLPKVIESHDIVHFSLAFEKTGNDVYKLGDEWPEMNYSAEIDYDEDNNVYELHYLEFGPSYIGRRYEGEVDEEFVRGFENLIRKSNVIENNGYYFHNEVTGKAYSLHINYKSDEKVWIHASGDAADVCPFDLKGLLEYFLPLINQ